MSTKNAEVLFDKTKQFLGGASALGIELAAPKDPSLASALAKDEPLPPGSIELGRITAKQLLPDGVIPGHAVHEPIDFGLVAAGQIRSRLGDGLAVIRSRLPVTQTHAERVVEHDDPLGSGG